MPAPIEEQVGLQERLLASDAVQSLLAEQRAASVLSNFHWRVEHGRFYTDTKSGKTREVDLHAWSLWVRQRSGGEQLARVHLYVEAKTLKNYHLVFAPVVMAGQGVWCQHDWIGYRSEPIEAVLRDVGFSVERITWFSRWFKRMAFSRRLMRVAGLDVSQPTCHPICSTFLETNIGNDRESDSSVLWKALHAVGSAIEADKSAQRAEDKDELLQSVAASPTGKPTEMTEFITHQLTQHANSIELYHPAIVVDAQLWLSKPNRLERLRWCRFALQGEGLGISWCDIIHTSAFEEWVSTGTDHYRRAMRTAKAKPPRYKKASPRKSQSAD